MEALFKLLRIALGGETDLSVPEGADWPALVALATEQGVAALAYDGLQKCYEADPKLTLPLDRELKAVKYDWFGATLNVEMKYEKQWKAVSSLSKAFAAEGLRTVVLKGFALSSCYPVPQHRYSCDFDCFLIGSGPVTDRGAYEQGNRALEAAGAKVDRSFYKHSSAKFKDVKVENHMFLVGWRGSARWKRFELELERMLAAPAALQPLSDTSLLVGPPLFNALFLTRHAQVHFLIEEGISLRHICDWAMFLRRYGPSLDWPAFMSSCDRYGMSGFAESMTRLASYVCGVPTPAGFAAPAAPTPGHSSSTSASSGLASARTVLTAGDLTPADRRLLDDILALGQHSSQPKSRARTAQRILRSGWKFRAFSDESPLGCLLRYLWGYFFVKEVSLTTN